MSASRTILLKIFMSALAIRWIYAHVLYGMMGDAGLMGTDSEGFYRIVEKFASEVLGGGVTSWEWLGPDLQIMPLYSWILAGSVLAGGSFGALIYVLIQGLFDAGTCVLVYLLAGTISARYALPAAIAAILNPTQIVVSGLVYHDTPFVFFVALFLLGSVLWLRKPSWPLALLIGAALGGGALFRILVGPWLAVHCILLLAGTLLLGRFRLRIAGQVAAIATIAALCMAPIVLRNGFHYGSWSLTPQGGTHLTTWIVPLVKEAADGTLWERTAADMQQRVKDRFGAPPANPFEVSHQQGQVGREALRELGVVAMAKAWTRGMMLNLASPAITLSPPVARLPRTGFYGTPGESFSEKVSNFLFRSTNALYAQLLLAGVAGVVLMRLIQLLGLWTMLRDGADRIGLALLAIWICYIFAINGPIGSPKYRLPIEPVLMVLAGAGWCGFRDLRGRKR
jgi:4-amino-4-deoxy-L-arabinose transferase-like glycosyltransferase